MGEMILRFLIDFSEDDMKKNPNAVMDVIHYYQFNNNITPVKHLAFQKDLDDESEKLKNAHSLGKHSTRFI